MTYRVLPSEPALRLGRLLGQCRRRDGLTQAKVGARLGVSVTTVSAWESGRYLPGAAHLLRLLYLYRIEPREADRVLAGEAYIPPAG